MTCTSGCKTQDHASYGQCLQAKAVKTYLASPSKGLDGTRQKRWDADLAAYRDAVRQGIQPESTNRPVVDKAVRLSDKAGAAYGRDFAQAAPMEA
ncbi:hypothetical protein STBA_10960 [Streptomyces sp. MP131-18]|nr:hypothetical protein STBA_10960 [Streptomyces sp. MP131-18]